MLCYLIHSEPKTADFCIITVVLCSSEETICYSV